MDRIDDSHRFVVAIHHTPRGCYAQVVNLPGCFARGATEVEALENVRGMIRTFITVAHLMARDEPRIRVEISA
jgi:predicted RNase H-like HicB family nuclease